jgi:hypothetical protein
MKKLNRFFHKEQIFQNTTISKGTSANKSSHQTLNKTNTKNSTFFNLNDYPQLIFKYVDLNTSCSEKICGRGYGLCVNNTSLNNTSHIPPTSTCICESGYLHVPELVKENCAYSQYSGTTTLILEIILPGLGCVYLGWYIWGIAKILLLPIVYYKWMKTSTHKFCSCLLISLIGYFLIYIHIRDLVMIISNKMKDYNNVPLYKASI